MSLNCLQFSGLEEIDLWQVGIDGQLAFTLLATIFLEVSLLFNSLNNRLIFEYFFFSYILFFLYMFFSFFICSFLFSSLIFIVLCCLSLCLLIFSFISCSRVSEASSWLSKIPQREKDRLKMKGFLQSFEFLYFKRNYKLLSFL